VRNDERHHSRVITLGLAPVAYGQREPIWEAGAKRPYDGARDPDATPTIPADAPSTPPGVTPLPAPSPVPRIEAESDGSSPPSLSSVSVAFARAPLKAAPYLTLALIEIDRNEYLKAERTLAKVIRLAPDFPEAHYRMGLLLARRGSLSLARRSFSNALEAAISSGRDVEEEERWVSLVRAALLKLARAD
jgi:tetratricopeptide (TPR) repeat protein